MANSCPLASSNATCLPEVYGQAALYFDPYSPEDIANTIKQIMKSEKLKKELIKKGHDQVAKYSWERMSQEIFKVIESLL